MSLSSTWFLLCVPAFLSLVCAQSSTQTLFPAAIPLAVKTPYMSAWHQSTDGSLPFSNSWPYFWSFNRSTIGWEGTIRVDGTTYQWMGMDASESGIEIANVTNIQITPTRTIFVMRVGPMNLTVTFLSPIEPDDWVKQSIPFSYVSVEAQSLDGNSYPVQLYTDITAEWASGDRNSQVSWSKGDTGRSIYLEIQLQNPQQNSEYGNQALDGTAYYAIASQSRVSWQIDVASTVRNGFRSNGVLANAMSTAFAPIQSVYTVFALAVDLGTIQSTSSPVTWSIGYVRDPSITYGAPSGAVQHRRPYYVTQYKNVEDTMDAFTSDYDGAHNRAVALDQALMNAAANVSSKYSDLVSLATRQTMSALDITVGTDSSGNLVPGDVKIFMKNLGTDRRVNPVEHVYAAFPAFLYLNASLGGSLLRPLLESQANLTGQTFAAADIGSAYPAAPAPEVVPQNGVEESGNMLLMALAHARISGDGTLLSQYYSTLKRWADYLVSTALHSENQTNQDGGISVSANTNIALKGILGVKTMAEIASVLGEDSDATEYGNQASLLFNSWLSLAMSSDGSHLLGSYGDQQSWSLMYNLFADKMLGLNFVPQSVVDMHTQYLKSLLAAASQWGLPIDSTTGQLGNAAWTMFASAFVSDDTVRDGLINCVYHHANSNLSEGVFPERYSTSDNSGSDGFAGRAYPALGGVFSHLILTVPNKTISVDSTGGQQAGGPGAKSNSKSSSNNAATTAGGVTGSLTAVGIVVAVFVTRIRKRRRQQHQKADRDDVAARSRHRPTLTPYYLNSTTDSSDRVGKGQDHMHINPPLDAAAGFAEAGAGDMGTHGSPVSLQATPVRPHQFAPLVATSPNVSSQTGSASSRDPARSPGGPVLTPDVLGLRAEVENLRREMQEIRAERVSEPPPEYTAEE